MSVTVIAEWGQSHQGSLKWAMRQADATKATGAQYAKWQIFSPERIASHHAKRYWDPSLGGSESQLETFAKNGMLGDYEWLELAAYCRHIGVEFLATPFDLDAVDLLDNIGVSAFKIASGDITYARLVKAVAATGKHVFLSTGASTPAEVLRAVEWLKPSPVTVLACSLIYPCPPEQANLRRITMLQEKMAGHRHVMGVGYSDHTEYVETALAATALGATTLEKHVSLVPDASHVPDDHMAISADCELGEYVRLANLGAKLTSGRDMLFASPGEGPARVGARRSLYATRNVLAGDVFNLGDIAVLRPWDPRGYSAQDEEHVYGTVCRRDVAKGELILHP